MVFLQIWILGGVFRPPYQLSGAPEKFFKNKKSEIPWLLSYMYDGSFATFPSFLALLEASE